MSVGNCGDLGMFFYGIIVAFRAWDAGAWVLGFRGRSYSAQAKRPFSAQAAIWSQVYTRKELLSLGLTKNHPVSGTARRRALAATNPLDKKSSTRAASFFARFCIQKWPAAQAQAPRKLRAASSVVFRDFRDAFARLVGNQLSSPTKCGMGTGNRLFFQEDAGTSISTCGSDVGHLGRAGSFYSAWCQMRALFTPTPVATVWDAAGIPHRGDLAARPREDWQSGIVLQRLVSDA